MRRRCFLGAMGAALATPRLSRAQGATTRIIYPFAPGGAGDALARILADRLGAAFGETVIVDNRTGGDGRIGMRAVAQAAPDGKTLLFTPFGPPVLHPFVYASLPYDTVKDFAPISRLVSLDFAIATGPETGANTISELVAWLKANPGKASYGIPGAGTVPHFLGVKFASTVGVDMRAVPYKGTTPGVADLIGGQIPMMTSPISEFLAQHRAGAIRILANSGAARSPFAPEVPTLRESGVDVAATGWYGLYAPAGAAADFIARVNAVVRETLLSEAGRARMAQLGFAPVAGSPQELAETQKRDMEFWAPAIRASGFKADD